MIDERHRLYFLVLGTIAACLITSCAIEQYISRPIDIREFDSDSYSVIIGRISQYESLTRLQTKGYNTSTEHFNVTCFSPEIKKLNEDKTSQDIFILNPYYYYVFVPFRFKRKNEYTRILDQYDSIWIDKLINYTRKGYFSIVVPDGEYAFKINCLESVQSGLKPVDSQWNYFDIEPLRFNVPQGRLINIGNIIANENYKEEFVDPYYLLKGGITYLNDTTESNMISIEDYFSDLYPELYNTFRNKGIVRLDSETKESTGKRFSLTKLGLIYDENQRLEWAPDTREKMTWKEAQDYIGKLNLGGYNDWRLPTRKELESLYDQSVSAEFKIDPVFQLSHGEVWTSEEVMDPLCAGSVWVFRFGGPGGFEGWFGCGKLKDGFYYNRPFLASHRASVLAVRSR